MDQNNEEFEKYLFIKSKFPQAICLKFYDKNNKNPNHFDILKTRFMYMEIFGSVPPENIWGLKKMLCGDFDSKSESKSEPEPNTTISQIEIIICTNNSNNLETKKIYLTISPNNSWNIVKYKIMDNFNSSNLLFTSPNGIIDFNSKIGDTKQISVLDCGEFNL